MPVVACLHHLDEPLLGHAAGPLVAAGLTVDERSPAYGEPLPTLEGVDGIISFGGAQSAVTPSEDLQAEIALLRSAVFLGIPVLGICLGGQLLASALGGEVTHASRRAVTWRSPSVIVDSDPLFGARGTRVPALHWNEDLFTLPPGAVPILGPEIEGVEAFRFGTCAWGVQFHPEVDAVALDGWYASYGPWLEEAGVTEMMARARDARWLPVQEVFSAGLFSRFADVVLDRVSSRFRRRAAVA
jgi:GMP synthase-like glutamine amidotransferase